MCSLMSETWTHVFLVKSSLILKPYNMADRRNVDTLAKVLEVHTTPTPGYERNILVMDTVDTISCTYQIIEGAHRSVPSKTPTWARCQQ